ncbi:S8 family peptidase [Devosia sp. FKR38]|uniref:S8 family peptidase n=1 Tax=Devosia sp. FKR38 TaxID=2562312 RepID=UPI0010BF859E|nr:S8 family peptidase [Devosia sp. FKR38]
MAEDRRTPLLNPVLLLTKEPIPESPPVSGQGEAGIVVERLSQQRAALSADLDRLAETDDSADHGGKLHVVATMFRDSYAPTWTPRGIVDNRLGSRLAGPAAGGYLLELDRQQLRRHASYVRTASSIEARTSISRVKSLKPVSAAYILHGKTPDVIWDEAERLDTGKAFILWLAPFFDQLARTHVVSTLERFEADGQIRAIFSGVTIPPFGGRVSGEELVRVINPDQSSIVRAARHYRSDGAARALIQISSKAAFVEVVSSGTVTRIDPVRKIEVTSPSVGAEPTPPVPHSGTQPVVAVVDGGMTAQSYRALEAWKAPSLLPDRVADHAHGNRVSSLVVHAHALNNQLNLPVLDCQFGTVQAIPRAGTNTATNTEMLIDYLRQVAIRFPEVKIWNMSFNQIEPDDDLELVSYLGHEIREIAREFDILPIISIGNQSPNNPNKKMCPPADCEAAITVSGRKYDNNGRPSGACDISLRGPGPDGMIKPDLSWFSNVKTIGGSAHTGSSYATPLVSSLAAHTYANLKSPSPDLVKALLIDRAELEQHDSALGWGTPYDGTMPWMCGDGTVTMAWRSELLPGYAYYWNDIPIPPELVRNGKLYGKARLTAILKPLVSQQGTQNYFSTRLQVALQYSQGSGKTGNLLGSMREDKAAEEEARSDLAKWNPVRRHARDFSGRTGLAFSGNSMRLHARIFARDLFQFDITSQRELGKQDVAFVLTFCGGSDSEIYSSTAQRLSNFVESAVLNQELQIDVHS